MEACEESRIVIVGGGVCGLATALALHRKGIESIILEKSKTLRATGAAIIIQANGWHALHQLGIAHLLRPTAISILSGQAISVEDGTQSKIPLGKGELRCLKRNDLINTLAENLPCNTIRLGCHVLSLDFESLTSSPVIRLHDGTKIISKVVIGCDGVNSVIAQKLGLGSRKRLSACVIRGFTDYTDGHHFKNEFVVWSKRNVQLGLLPITHKLVYWFVTRDLDSQDCVISRDQRLIKESTMEHLNGFPANTMEIVKKSQVESLHLTDLKYKAPWDLLQQELRRGTVTVAGDAMHAMGPFLAQGGSASIEDAVILARCFSQKLSLENRHWKKAETRAVEEAIDEYIAQRKMRIFWLSFQTFLIGRSMDTTSALAKLLTFLLLLILFRDASGHSRYKCGNL